MNYFWTVYVPVILHGIHWFLVNKADLKKQSVFFTEKYFKLIWNGIMLPAFLAVSVSALLQLYFPSTFAYQLHRNSGLLFIVLAVLHVLGRLWFFQGFIREWFKK